MGDAPAPRGAARRGTPRRTPQDAAPLGRGGRWDGRLLRLFYPPPKWGYVYALLDPQTRRIFYVGSTVDPISRCRGHLTRWTVKPLAAILQRVPLEDATAAESAWILYLRTKGVSLRFNRRTPAARGWDSGHVSGWRPM